LAVIKRGSEKAVRKRKGSAIFEHPKKTKGKGGGWTSPLLTIETKTKIKEIMVRKTKTFFCEVKKSRERKSWKQ